MARPHPVGPAARAAFAAALLAIWSLGGGALAAAQGETSWQGLRLPRYRNGFLHIELRAEQGRGSATRHNGRTEGDVNLRGVVIRVYDIPQADSATSPTAADADERPPLSVVIRSQEGAYNHQAGEAALSGDVEVIRYVPVEREDGSTVRVPEARIYCDKAVWDSANQQLQSSGHVRLKRPNGDILEGEDLVYSVGDDGDKRAGVLLLRRQVSMVVHSMADAPAPEALAAAAEAETEGPEAPAAGADEAPAEPGSPRPSPAEVEPGEEDLEEEPGGQRPAHVVCDGAAWYYLKKDEVHFSKNVVVTRVDAAGADDVMRSEKLKVVMERDRAAGRSRVVQLHAEEDVRVRGVLRRGEQEGVPYTADSRHAVYDASRNILVFKGDADDLPEVRFGDYRIRDEFIVLQRGAGKLTAAGRERQEKGVPGNAWLRPPARQGEVEGERELYHITYTKGLVYDRHASAAVFTGGITLDHAELRLTSNELEVRTPEPALDDDDAAAAPQQVRRVTARGEVEIRLQDGRRARAAEAVFDTIGRTLTLTGPPDPVVEQTGEFRIRAPRITSRNVGTGDAGGAFGRVKTDGPGEMLFLVDRQTPEAAGPATGRDWRAGTATLVRYEESMDYRQNTQRAVFLGAVVLTHGELVLNAGQLEVALRQDAPAGEEAGEGAAPAPARDGGEGETASMLEDAGLRISQLIARQDVEMHAGGRHSAAARMLYDVGETGEDGPTLTLYGDETARARLWEEGGAALRGQRIVDYQEQYRIVVDGPGELTLTERNPVSPVPRSARIHFDRQLVYTARPRELAVAQFFRGVRMRWQGMTVEGDRLDAELGEATNLSAELRERRALGEGREPGLLKREILNAVVQGNVSVTSGGRVATGDTARVVRQEGSVELIGEPSAELRDRQGLRLVAPRFLLFRQRSLLTADGPGTLYVAGPAAAAVEERTGRRRRGAEADARDEERRPGEAPRDYTLAYQEQMVYSFTDRRLLFEGEVTLDQQTLHGRCDRLEALLTVNEETDNGSRDPDTQGLTLASAVCTGDVFFRRYEPPSGDETLAKVLEQGPSKKRPGRTSIVECEKAVYDVTEGQVIFSSTREPVRIVEQEVSPSLKVSRTFYDNIEKAVLDAGSGDVSFPFGNRRPRIKYMPSDGPLQFPD